MPACPNCDADLMAEYVWIPLPDAGHAGDTEPRETKHCPFCGEKVVTDEEANLQ